MNNRTVNLKAVLILTLGFLALGVGVHILHGYQVKRNARALYDLAESEEKQGHIREAANYLELYLGMEPGNTDALARYVTMLHQLAKTGREYFRVYELGERVLRSEGQRQDIRLLVAKVALLLGRFPDARVHLKILEEGQPNNAEVWHLGGRCELAARQFDKAEEKYRKALKLGPDQIEVYVEFAYLLRLHLQQDHAADGIIDRMVSVNNDKVPARLAAAYYYNRLPDTKDTKYQAKAQEHIRFAVEELKSEDSDVLLVAAEIAQKKGNRQEARKFLDRGLELYPEHLSLRLSMVQLEKRDGHRTEALALLKHILKEPPTNPDYLWNIASHLLDLGEREQATDLIRRLEEGGSRVAAAFLRSRSLMQERAWGDARQLLDSTRPSVQPDSQMARYLDLALAECHERLGNPDQVLAATQRILKNNESLKDDERLAVPAIRLQAAAHASIGDSDKAIQEYKTILSLAPEVREPLARLQLARSLRRPADQRTWTDLEKLLQDLPEGTKPTADMVMLRAEMLVAQNKLNEARKLIEQERDRDPKEVKYWIFLVALAERESKSDTVLPLLDTAEKQAGKRVEWQLLRLRQLLRSSPDKAKEYVDQLEKELDQLPDAEKDQLLSGLATARFSMKDFNAAQRHWRQLAQRQPKNLNVRLLLFEMSLQPDQLEEARRIVDEIQRIEGGRGALTTYGKTVLLLREARLNNDKIALRDARQWLTELRGLRPTWSRVPLLEADTYELENRMDLALEKYKEAIHLGEDRQVYYMRAIQLMYKLGRPTEAQELIRKLPEQALATRDLGRMVAEVSLLNLASAEGADTKQARKRILDQARKTVPAKSDDFSDYLWLGEVASMAGELEEAEKNLREALRLKKAPETWLALILFLARNDARKARIEMDAANTHLPKDQIALVLAPGHEALGELAEAEKQYDALLKSKPDDPQMLRIIASFHARIGQAARADPHLRKLLNPATKAPEATVIWARRTLAIMLAGGGNQIQSREALALLEVNLKSNPNSVEDQRVKALVLAAQPGQRAVAIAAFEDLSNQQTAPSSEIQFYLAQLYNADDNWPKAQLAMAAALSAQPKNPVYLARFSHIYLLRKEYGDAQALVERLVTINPDAFETKVLQARILHALGKSKAAVDLLKGYAERDNARMESIGLLLDQLGQPAEAEAMLRRWEKVSKKPEGVLPLAILFARNQRMDEALAICERAWENCQPENVGGVSVFVLRIGPGSPAQAERVEKWIGKALEKPDLLPDARLSLTVTMAELQDFRGRYSEAITLYREILLQDDGKRRVFMLALNNLAYLLAMVDPKNTQALDLVNRAIDREGPAPELLDTRAAVYVKGNQPDLALKDIRQVVTQSNTPNHYYRVAQVHLMLKDRKSANEAMQRARELDFKPEQLHALEKNDYQQLAKELKLN